MYDETEDARRQRKAEIAAAATERQELEKSAGQVWDTDQLKNDFDVKGFMAPFVVVVRKSDGVTGTLEFQHMPRYYFNFCKE